MYKIYADGELLCDSRIDELALISPNGSLAANVAGEFSFTIPSTHPKYNLIKIKSTVVRIFRDDEKNPMMEAIAVSESIDFFKNRTIQCEGALSFLNDTVLRPSLRNGYTVEQLLTAYINEHNAQVGKKKKFCVGRITVSTSNLIYTSTNMTSTFEQIKSDLLDDLGGYMMVRYEDGERFIDYLATAVETSEQKIELGKNLLDYKSNIDSENFATRIIPLGATLEDTQQTLEGVSQRLTISSVNGGRDFVCNSEAEKDHDVTVKTIVFDDLTDPVELMAKGDAYMRSIQFRNVYIEAKAIDFGYLTNKIQKFSLLKRVNVLSSAHGLDGYFMLTKMDFELNSPENDVFVFGSTEAAKMQSSKTLSAKSQETIREVENQIEEIHEDVGGLKVTLEKTDEGLLAEVVRAQGAENELSGRIEVLPGNVELNVSNGEDSAYISLTITKEDGTVVTTTAKTIKFKGNVIFASDLQDGTTVISGDNIKTGTISADRIDVNNLVAKKGNFNQFNVLTFKTGSSLTSGTVHKMSLDSDGMNLVCGNGHLSGITPVIDDFASLKISPTGFDFKANGSSKHARINGNNIITSGNIGDQSVDYANSAGSATNATNSTNAWKLLSTDNKYSAWIKTDNKFSPGSNNSMQLGSASYKWSEVFAGTGTINTSDRNSKENIKLISDKYIDFFELLAPVSFQFIDGTSGRTHIGFIAQDVEWAMEQVGLTDLEFAGFCKDVKTEYYTDDDGQEKVRNVLDENGNPIWIYSLRYSEFIALNTAVLQKTKNELVDLKKILKKNGII